MSPRPRCPESQNLAKPTLSAPPFSSDGASSAQAKGRRAKPARRKGGTGSGKPREPGRRWAGRLCGAHLFPEPGAWVRVGGNERRRQLSGAANANSPPSSSGLICWPHRSYRLPANQRLATSGLPDPTRGKRKGKGGGRGRSGDRSALSSALVAKKLARGARCLDPSPAIEDKGWICFFGAALQEIKCI